MPPPSTTSVKPAFAISSAAIALLRPERQYRRYEASLSSVEIFEAKSPASTSMFEGARDVAGRVLGGRADVDDDPRVEHADGLARVDLLDGGRRRPAAARDGDGGEGDEDEHEDAVRQAVHVGGSVGAWPGLRRWLVAMSGRGHHTVRYYRYIAYLRK